IRGTANQGSGSSSSTRAAFLRAFTVKDNVGGLQWGISPPRGTTCWSPVSLNQAVLDGVASRRATRADADLAEDRAQMCVDGTRAQAERFGDLSVGQARGDQLQDVHLSGCQVIRIRLAQDPRSRSMLHCAIRC